MTAHRKLLLATLVAAGLAACQPSADNDATSSAQRAAPSNETSRDFGDYVVHFNALSTDQLTADVAKSYDIVRSPNRAMLTISIIKKAPGTIGSSVAGTVTASATNLTGQLKQINVREIGDGDAIYYIGEITVANEETLTFSAQVTPAEGSESFPVEFRKQFFTD